MKPNNHNVYCTFYDAPEHAFPGHPESPQRLQRMQTWLQDPPYPEIIWLAYEPAREGEVGLVHHTGMLESLQQASRKGTHEIEPSPTYVTEGSYQAALMAAGATLTVSRRILAEGYGRGFAIVRPPGHHAEPGRSMGFCLLNNIAIAAADAIASGLSKVAILDFDAHHGNGTQAIFTSTPQVGYFSTHEEKLYPGSGHMHAAPHAYGRIINVPLPSFANPSAILSIFQEVAVPWLKQFGAEMLFISAGFDTHFSDPLTTTTLDTRSFYELSQMFIEAAEAYCQNRILFVLEGGYDPLALQDNIQACLAALCGRTAYPDHFGSSPGGRSNVADQIRKLKDLHQLTEE